MPALSPTATRTRTSIMTSAIALLAARPEAPMSDVAEAAGVSRSTLHRYFPDRAALRAALNEHATRGWQDAVERARLAEGTGLEAFRRLCGSLTDALDVLAWWMSAPETWDDDDGPDEFDLQILDALRRGQADGSLDPMLRPEWIHSLIWSVLYAVRFNPADSGLSNFEAREQGLRTLMKAAAADPTRVREA